MKEGLPNHSIHMSSIRKAVSKWSSRCGATAIEEPMEEAIIEAWEDLAEIQDTKYDWTQVLCI